MIKPDRYFRLKMKKKSAHGILLTDGESDVLLPASDSVPSFHRGKEIDVFVYNNRDSLRATERRPLAVQGEFAALTVKSVEPFGVFAEWGIPKDLFIPTRNLDHDEYEPGETIIVRLTPNFGGDTTVGDCYIEDYLETDGIDLKPNDKVEILIYKLTKLGACAVVGNRFFGLLYHHDAQNAFYIGERRNAYVKKIREDGRIDLTLFPQGYRASQPVAEKTLLDALKAAGGVLPLGDASAPEEIEAAVGMSKALFKRTAGALYKRGKILIFDNKITLPPRRKPRPPRRS